MKLFASMCAAILLTACASHSGVIPVGQHDTFMISRQAATGFSGMGSLRAETIREANTHCSSMGKSVEITDTHESQPPYVLGNYPRIDLTFRCVAA